MACLICMAKFPDDPARYSFKLDAGPANAWKHLNGVHGLYDHSGAGRADKKQMTLTASMIRPEHARRAFLEEMVRDLRPFAFLESRGRAGTQRTLMPSVPVPSDSSLRADLQKEYDHQRQRLVTAFERLDFVHYFCLMMDGWTLSLKGRLMYACRVRFLTEKMQLVEIPLEVSTIEGKDAAIVARWVQSAVQRAGLDMKHCLVITADGAERASVLEAAEVQLREARFAVPQADADLNWIAVAGKLKIEYFWCIDHRLSLVVKAGLSSSAAFVASTREVSRFIQKTNKVRLQYDKITKEAGISQLRHYSDTRYAEAVLMGASFVKNEDAIKAVRRFCDQSEDPTVNQFHKHDFPDTYFAKWASIIALYDPLIKLVTTLSVSNKCCVSQALPAILKLRSSLAVTPPGTIAAVATIYELTRAALNKYFAELMKLYDNQVADGPGDYIVLATALSPQLHLLPKETADTISISARFRLDVVFCKLFPDEYAKMKAKTMSLNGGLWSIDNSALSSEWRFFRTSETLRENITDDMDPFLWWTKLTLVFPKLSKLARAVLSIPVTSTPVERMWNKTKRVFSKLRGRLLPEMGGKQVYVREMWDWLDAGGEAVMQEYATRGAGANE
jgi:hypothetical protein